MPQSDIPETGQRQSGQPPTGQPRFAASDPATALGLLTRLPVAGDQSRSAASGWAWPLAGLAVALPAALVVILATRIGLAPVIAAGLALAGQTLLTGAMHEDGLADSADGLWGGWTRERRLEIMKGSTIGTYGTMALILVTGLRWLALGQIFAAGFVLAPLLAAAALSRAPMAAVMALLPNARGAGLSQSVGQPARHTAATGAALALGIALLLLGLPAVPAAIAAACATFGAMKIAKAKIGGQTGDILGATQQLAECAILMVLSVTL